MSLGGFHLSQFKITYSAANFSSLYSYGTSLLSEYANAIVTASGSSDGGWSIDVDKVSGADDTVNGIPIYNFQTRIPVWGTEYPSGSYNIGCFLKYNNGTIVRHLFLMLNTCIYYFNESPSSGSDDKNSLRFNRLLGFGGQAPYESSFGGAPISFGAMCRVEPFDITELCDLTKGVSLISDTPLFPITGNFIDTFQYLDYDANIPFNYRKLSKPNDNDSFVLGVCVKGDIIISIFRDSSWNIGNYTCTIFGNIVDCYREGDTKNFGVIQGNCGFYSNWINSSDIYEIYGNKSYEKVIGCFIESNSAVSLKKEYLSSVLSHIEDNTAFCAYTGSYLSFVGDISNSENGSKYKGKINTDVFRQCNELTGSGVVLEGNFIRIGSCLVGWDPSNSNLFS